MKKTYRVSGSDRASGLRRSQTIRARNHADIVRVANEIGILPDEFEEFPARRQGFYEVVYAVMKTLAFFVAIVVVITGFSASDTVFQQILAVAGGCFFGILARLFQAEEKSRR